MNHRHEIEIRLVSEIPKMLFLRMGVSRETVDSRQSAGIGPVIDSMNVKQETGRLRESRILLFVGIWVFHVKQSSVASKEERTLL